MQYLYIVIGLTVSFLLMVLAGLVPFWMPMMEQMIALLVVAVLLTIWAGFVLTETAADEREVHLKMQAGRFGYVAGLAILLVALLVQGFAHHIDPWVAGALAAMVLTKLGARAYFS